MSRENVRPFVGVRRLLPGHYLIWRDGQVADSPLVEPGEQSAALA